MARSTHALAVVTALAATVAACTTATPYQPYRPDRRGGVHGLPAGLWLGRVASRIWRALLGGQDRHRHGRIVEASAEIVLHKVQPRSIDQRILDARRVMTDLGPAIVLPKRR